MSVSRRKFVRTLGAAAGITASLSRMSAPATPGAVRSASAPSVRPIGSEGHLFADEELISSKDHVSLKLHAPQKTGERLIESEHPWENATLNWFSVVKDADRYRMWYECYDVDGWPTADDTSLCYAESADGIQWEKPQLGLVTYQGSKKNNIVFRQIGERSYRSRVHGSCVFVDPAAPPESRFKCVSQGLFQGVADKPYFVAGMTSPDGLQWTRLPDPICRVFADSQYSAFRGPDQQLVLFGRVSGYGGRAIGRSTSQEFGSFAPLELVLQAGEEDPPLSDLYNPACMKYPGRADLYLMCPSMFRHKEDTLDIRLAVSRDGIHWTWPDRGTPLIPLGESSAFDGGSLYFANGGCVPTGDDLSFYFSGSSLRHEEVELENLASPTARRVISRAVQRRDRLISITAGESGGQFETYPLSLKGNTLLINADVRSGGEVRVALLNMDGHEIPGYTAGDCHPLTENCEQCAVTWSENARLNESAKHPLRVRFSLRNADVFGFRSSDNA
jgi:hypothetical protein